MTGRPSPTWSPRLLMPRRSTRPIARRSWSTVLRDSAAFATVLAQVQPSLTFKAVSPGNPAATASSGSLSVVSVAVSVDGNGVVMAAYSVPATVFYIVKTNAALSAASTSSPPYVGDHPVTEAALPATGPLVFRQAPARATSMSEAIPIPLICNAYSPKISGPDGDDAVPHVGISSLRATIRP